MDIIFCGTPEFSVPPLADLVAAGFNVKAVFTQPDRRKGRGQQVQKTAVKIEAEKHHIPVYQPVSLKTPDVASLISDMKPDLMVVVAYGLIIPQNILDIPKWGCWNIHASLLPRWRGAAPIHRAILTGDKETGIAIMQMEAGLDTGPVFNMYPTTIRDDDTGQTLHDRLSLMGGEAIVSCVQQLKAGTLPAAQAQNEAEAIYAHKLEKSESHIDWHQSAQHIEQQIRAFNPWPGSQGSVNDMSLKVWAAKVIACETNQAQEPGTVVMADKSTLIIQCGDGCLSLEEVQKAGKKRMPIAAFMASKSAWFTA
ncbi:methionyl-tRNA formyltransferase [Marinicella sp. S1101]|uniref:methionyl-tRNA formyltransferase n=1 Tax=Marinicella marina TaxID=2996016 RepID=UPI002260CC95|nr:methionyl-tRNA formyltransferase [Marinicella marina]MCX7552880.1 methionyl-tRNA formyltransferase [Marinicella marina]MDJ1139811.1 methionyl-tRNA formyltransferase [Marinicella marina]